MTILTLKVAPYVYWLTHKETGHFYIGYREANKVPSDQDLGIVYFTSSKKIRELKFENFNFQIIAEFFSADSAYEFENRLIEEHFKNPLCLNNRYTRNGKKILRSNRKGKKSSALTKLKISIFRTGRKASEETKKKMSFSHKGLIKSKETCLKLSRALKGRTISNETRAKISKLHKGKTISDEHKTKLSEFFSGRKRKPHSEESKAKMSNSHKLRVHKPHSEETKAKMSAATHLYWENKRLEK